MWSLPFLLGVRILCILILLILLVDTAAEGRFFPWQAFWWFLQQPKWVKSMIFWPGSPKANIAGCLKTFARTQSFCLLGLAWDMLLSGSSRVLRNILPWRIHRYIVHAYCILSLSRRLFFFVQHHILGVEAAARHLLSLPFLPVFGHKSGRQGGKPVKDVEGNLVVWREITQISTWQKPGKNQVADLSYLYIYIYLCIYLFLYIYI